MARVILSDSVLLFTRIPKRVHRALRVDCVETGVTVQEWVAEALEASLRRCRGPHAVEPPSRESA